VLSCWSRLSRSAMPGKRKPSMANEKQHGCELIERLAPGQLTAVVGLLEAMIDPVSSAIAKAPYDDEPESEAERQTVAASKAWFEKHGKGIPHEEIAKDLGL